MLLTKGTIYSLSPTDFLASSLGSSNWGGEGGRKGCVEFEIFGFHPKISQIFILFMDINMHASLLY